MHHILRIVCYTIFIILIAGALMENALNNKIYTKNIEAIQNIYVKYTEEIKTIYKIYNEDKLENFCGITLVPWTILLLTFLAMMIIWFCMLDPIIRKIWYAIRCCFLIGRPVTMSKPHNHIDKTCRPKQVYYFLPDYLLE